MLLIRRRAVKEVILDVENSPLTVGIIIAEACESERSTVVLAVFVGVYEDVVVFHVLDIISRGIFVKDIVDAFRNQLFHFPECLVEGVVETCELNALVLLVRKKKEGLVSRDLKNSPFDAFFVVSFPEVIGSMYSRLAVVSMAVFIEIERESVALLILVRDIGTGKTCMIVLVDALCHAVLYCGDCLFQRVLLADEVRAIIVLALNHDKHFVVSFLLFYCGVSDNAWHYTTSLMAYKTETVSQFGA